MAKLLDKILVVDVESTCWEGRPPNGQSSEIIEIGLCVVDAVTLKREEKRSFLLRPVRSEVSDFCTQLTSITPAMLTDAGSLADAVHVLRRQYMSAERLWASWGDYDRRQFERVCRELGVGYPFGTSHLNVKSLFAIAHGLSREIGMEGALRQLGWKLEGTHHRGEDDAWNIGRVLCQLLQSMRGDGNVRNK